jgi:hypothetical protein
MKTMNGNGLPRIHSPIPARINSIPPNQSVAPTVATPLPPDPLQPMNSIDSGVSPTENPSSAMGVGLAKRLRRSPATEVCSMTFQQFVVVMFQGRDLPEAADTDVRTNPAEESQMSPCVEVPRLQKRLH